jgi:pyrimidine nucleoside transport protein
VVEAASNGAISAIKVVSSVAANLIALLGLIAFLDASLLYIGGTIGVEALSFKVGVLIFMQLNLSIVDSNAFFHI